MVNFRELEILKCGKALILDITLDYMNIFPAAYISQIVIDTGKTYVENGPSSTPIYSANFSAGTTTIVEEITKDVLNVDLNKEILFVYVIVNGLPTDFDEIKYGSRIGVKSVVNLYNFYKNIIGSINNIGVECSNNDDFINAFLMFKAYEYSDLTCNYYQLIKLWDRFVSGNKTSKIKTCGCNG